jgi:hypothetical protein
VGSRDGGPGRPVAIARAGEGIGGGAGSPLGDGPRDPAVVDPAGAGEVTILVGASLGDAEGVRCVAVPEAILALRLRASNGSWLMCNGGSDKITSNKIECLVE